MLVLKPDKVLDCSGQHCPMPIVEASRAIQTLKAGQVLKLIATDLGAPADMQAWANQTGNRLIDIQERNDQFIFYFERAC